MEMFNTLTDYNERKHTPLPNGNIQEAMRMFMDEESISDDDNATVGTFSHTAIHKERMQT